MDEEMELCHALSAPANDGLTQKYIIDTALIKRIKFPFFHNTLYVPIKYLRVPGQLLILCPAPPNNFIKLTLLYDNINEKIDIIQLLPDTVEMVRYGVPSEEEYRRDGGI